MKRPYLAALGGFLTIAGIACNQNQPSFESSKILGTLELSVSNGLVGQAKFTPTKLRTQGILNESQLVFAPTAVANIVTETNGTRNFDYVSRHFTITNNTGAAISNLTLVALAKTGNIGNTAIKTATAFNGSTADATTAQLARPTHTMTASNGIVSVDDGTDISRASFQALTTAEATAIQGDSNFAAQGLTGTVLEYGFAATNTAANSRTIASGASGKVSIAMRFPKPTTATSTYSFVMTFAVTAESTNRVTRSPEDTTAKANARATTLGATQKVLLDNPAVITSPPTGYTVQNNLKISAGTTPLNLLKNPAKLVIARVYAGGAPSITNAGLLNSVYASDFVEIFNAGEFSATFNPTGTTNDLSLQYGRISGSANIGAAVVSQSSVIDISGLGIIPAGGYKLVSTDTTPGATPSGTSSPPSETSIWNLGLNYGVGGKIALVTGTTALNCGGSTACVSAPIVDLFTHTTAPGSVPNLSETAPLVYTGGVGFDNQNNTLAFTRVNNGCTDVNDNSTDFSIGAITNTSARNSTTPVFICP